MRTRRLLTAGLLACALPLYAACGGGSDDESPGGSAAGGASGDSTLLNVAAADDAVTFDPVFSSAPRGNEVIVNAYDPSVTYELKDGPDGTKIPDLTKPTGLSLESIEPNEDFTEWTLKLRSGLKFPNGDLVTIEDLRYTFERSLDYKDSPGQFMYGLIANIPDMDAVEIVDDSTLTVALRAPNQMFARILTLTNGGIVQRSLITEHATTKDPFAGDWVAKNSAGAGAYSLESWAPGQSIVLKANPNYGGTPKPSIKTVNYRIVPSAANRVALLRRGEVDVIGGLSADDVTGLQDVDGVKVVSVPNTYQLSLVMHNKKEPFKDVKVRQAIASALPYKQLIDEVYGGRAQSTAGPVPVGFPNGATDGYPYTEQNIEKAKSLLAEAGKSDGFKVTMQVSTDQPDQERAAVVIQAALAQIGVEVQIEKLTASVFNERRAKYALSFFLNLTGWDVSDPAYAMQLGYGCTGFGNYAQACDEDFDKRVAAAASEADADKRAELFDGLQKELWELTPQAWILQPNFTFAMRDNISGYTDFGDLRIRYRFLTKK
jgi:peptide/nickel transport system substrate-binding protein